MIIENHHIENVLASMHKLCHIMTYAYIAYMVIHNRINTRMHIVLEGNRNRFKLSSFIDAVLLMREVNLN